MQRLGLLLALSSTLFAGPSIHVLVDRPGHWEAEWRGPDWEIREFPDDGTSFRNAKAQPPSHPGDLDASRLGILIALPSVGDWTLSYPVDSGREVAAERVARVKGWDPAGQTYVAVAPASPPATTVESQDGFRLLRLDLPLARLEASGRIRLTRHLRIKLEWSGRTRLRAGSVWSGVVDNPGGTEAASAFAGRSARFAKGDSLAGRIASFEIGDADLFGSREDGLVRLTGKQVADALKIDVRAIRMSSIAVWSGPADTLRSKADTTTNAPALVPIPIQRRDLDGDDVFGASDEILFWAHGPNIWLPDSSSAPGWSYLVHPYARTRRYLIRWDASHGSPEMGAPVAGGSPATFDRVRQPVYVGKPVNRLELMSGESVALKDLGIGWFWMSTKGLSGLRLADSSRAGLPGLASDTGWLKVRVANSGVLRGLANRITAASIDGGPAWSPLASLDPYQSVWSGTGLTSSSGFQLAFPLASDMPIEGYQLTYQRDLSGLDSALFPAPALGPVAVRAKNGSGCLVLERGVAVRTCEVSGGYLRDSVRVPGTWFALFPAASPGLRPAIVPRPEPVGSHVVRDYEATRKADVLVVSPRDFIEAAEQYAKHREASFQVRPLKVAVAVLEDIYDLWSGGMTDPVAIRDAVRWASSRWQTSHVLLLGAGHADPRNVLGSSPESRLPHWQYLESRDSQASESSDDFYAGRVSNGAWPGDVAVGRVPVRTLAEAQGWLAKLAVFEDPAKAEFGPWRNRLLFTADDMLQNGRVDIIRHTEQVENIARSVDTARPWVRFDKVYLVQYPLNAIGQKPEAARDLQSIVNQGVAGMCYLGHGGMGLMADENLLDVPAIERTFKNANSPFLFTAGSCTVGRNDLPNTRGLADALVTTPGKGSFASVAATRPTYAPPNEAFMTEFWTVLASPRTAGTTLGEALLRAKSKGGNATNNARYNLLGDPALVPFPGGLSVEPDSIGDTLPAFSKVRFSGKAGSAGWVQSRIDIPLAPDSVVLTYQVNNNSFQEKQVFLPPAQQFLSSQTAAAAGAYAATVGLPARVPFGSHAFVKTYAWDPKTRRDGGAKSGRKLFWGTATTGASDQEGPVIALRPCDSSWSGGLAFDKEARFPLPFCIAVDVADTSGVSFDQGPDEGLVLTIPGVLEAWHPELRQLSDYRSASANLILDSSQLRPGSEYALDVSARDLMGNLSRKRLLLRPQLEAQPGLYEVFNSPNPVKEGTSTVFYFKLTADADTNGAVDSRATASIRIHTVSGKLVKILHTELSSASSPLPRAVWDLRDTFGKPLANGLYPFTVVLRIPTLDGMGTIQRQAKGVVAISR
jgi:hypothetical protein